MDPIPDLRGWWVEGQREQAQEGGPIYRVAMASDYRAGPHHPLHPSHHTDQKNLQSSGMGRVAMEGDRWV